MNGQQIIDMFNEMTDDAMDETQALIYMNMAKNIIESERDWNFNRAFDNSKSIAAGDNYLSTKALPSAFLVPRKVFIAGDLTPLILISFDERERYKDVYKRYYIDHLNGTFALCGSSGNAGSVINMYYGRKTDDITLSTSPVWPSMFHPYLAFKMAEMWASGADADDVNYRMSKENLRISREILRSFILWDAKIKTMEYNAKNEGNVDLGSYPNVVGW